MLVYYVVYFQLISGGPASGALLSLRNVHRQGRDSCGDRVFGRLINGGDGIYHLRFVVVKFNLSVHFHTEFRR